MHLKTGNIWVWVVDPILGAVRSQNKFFNSRFTPIAVTRIEDLNDDNRPDIGVMAIKKATNAVFLKVKDEFSWSKLKKIRIPK